MNPKLLKKGCTYRYTAGIEPVDVIYVREVINGYVFTDDIRENTLHSCSVESYIESVCDSALTVGDLAKGREYLYIFHSEPKIAVYWGDSPGGFVFAVGNGVVKLTLREVKQYIRVVS